MFILFILISINFSVPGQDKIIEQYIEKQVDDNYRIPFYSRQGTFISDNFGSKIKMNNYNIEGMDLIRRVVSVESSNFFMNRTITFVIHYTDDTTWTEMNADNSSKLLIYNNFDNYNLTELIFNAFPYTSSNSYDINEIEVGSVSYIPDIISGILSSNENLIMMILPISSYQNQTVIETHKIMMTEQFYYSNTFVLKFDSINEITELTNTIIQN